LADKALGKADIPMEVKTDIIAHDRSFRLGAVFVDLPYYERLWLNGIRAMAKRDIRFGRWGAEFHARCPSNLMLAFMDEAQSPADRAFAMGALTHYAVDIIFHREIQSRVLERSDRSKSDDSAHRQLEEEMDFYVHCGLTGNRGMGTPYARRALAIYPANAWISHARRAVASAHSSAPGRLQLLGWQNNLALFGLASSLGMSFGVHQRSAVDPNLQKMSLDLADESIALAARYMETGAAYCQGRMDREGFLRAIPNTSMLDGERARNTQ
jgi:hypothetical protein